MTLKVNLVGEDAQLTTVRDALLAADISAAINMPLSEDTPLVICVPAARGVTPPLIETLKRAVGQKVQLAALLFTGTGEAVEKEVHEMLLVEALGVLTVFFDEAPLDGLRTLKQWKEGWAGKLSKTLKKSLSTIPVMPAEKWRIKQYSEKAFFKYPDRYIV